MDTLTTTLTEEQAAAVAAGGIVGFAVGTIFIVIGVLYVLNVIARWKIFTKAGEAGWKSLIPIYNDYILCRIIHINFIYWYIIPIVALAILGAILPNIPNVGDTLNGVITAAYTIALEIILAIKLGDAFKKSTGFKVGLFFLPHIFQMIIGFGSSKYALKAEKAEK